MRLEDLIKSGNVRKSFKDPALVRSLKETADLDIKFLRSLEINDHSSRKIVSNYYDVLRSILEAIALEEGYKVYTHEAFTYLLKEKGQNIFAAKFDRLRKIRNKINYYGKKVSVDEAKELVKEIEDLIRKLKVLLK